MGLLSYMKPAKGKKDVEKAEHSKPELTEKSPVSDASIPRPPITPGPSSPGVASPWGSRPASLYPAGDWRNSQSEDILEIKCDVMVNWLYQQQMERLWTAGGHDEGVILKKGRGAYTCCPADLIEEPYGFFKAVETLNVKVSV